MPPSDDDMTAKPQQSAFRVLGGLYDMVRDETDFEPMFHAMDDFIDDTLGPQHVPELAPLWRDLLREHFNKAERLFDVVQNDRRPSLQDFVAGQTIAAAVTALDGTVLAQNAPFEALSKSSEGRLVYTCLAGPKDRARLQDLTAPALGDGQTLLNFHFDGRAEPCAFLARRIPNPEAAAPDLIQLILLRPQWNAEIEALLRQAFDLTDAETAILRAFVATGSVAKVAQARGRAIRTVRTQLSQIFARLGVVGQTELAFFLASLGTYLTPGRDGRACVAGSSAPSQHVTRKTTRIADRTLEYLCYGLPDGKPVLLIQPTHPPELTPALRSALTRAGLRIFAPLKPGSGQTSAQSSAQSCAQDLTPLVRDYLSLLDAEGIGKVTVAGQASGGLYALNFARACPARTEAVFLADTGVPFKTRSELMALPKAISRTFIPARYFPELLKLPHRLIAANFHRSKKGEARIVDYFFEGSPLDQALTRRDPEYYDITREIVRFSFESTDRLVRDVSRWASDWQPLLDHVAASHPIRFFHGADNTMFLATKIRDYTAKQILCDAVLIDGCAQLVCFQRPAEFAAALAEMPQPRPCDM